MKNYPYLVPLGLLLLGSPLAGCSDSGPPRAAIAGQVTVGGQPLVSGRILFVPIEPAVGPAAAAKVAGGKYRLEAEEGPVVGQNRVEVEADLPLGFELDDEQAFAKRGGKPLPRQPIPAQFNRNSQLVVDVQQSDQNQFDVVIPATNQTASGGPR